jgi:hypothetical protein
VPPQAPQVLEGHGDGQDLRGPEARSGGREEEGREPRPGKDFTKDPKCLACHTTGYGTPTGYPAPPAEGKAWTEAEQQRATRLAGVTCEACHGPGSLYGPYKKDHEQFKLEEIQKLGATTPPTAKQCLVCHVKECPTMPADYTFDFEKAKKSSKDFHEHVPLKYPH